MGFKDWETPRDFHERLDSIYTFSLDAAASHENALCYRYCTIEGTFERELMQGGAPIKVSDLDGLNYPWTDKRVFCNPPYDSSLKLWVAKAARCEAIVSVLLLPPSVDTAWFHDYVYSNPNCDYRFLEGRLKFWKEGKPGPAPRAGNMLATFYQV